MVIKANSLNNAATKYLAHCQISRQQKSSKIFTNGQILQTFIFTFLLGVYNLKPVALFTNSMKKCVDIENVGSVCRIYAFFTRKMSVNQLNMVFALPCFNKFLLTQKNFNCFVRYKTIPTLLCKDRR